MTYPQQYDNMPHFSTKLPACLILWQQLCHVLVENWNDSEVNALSHERVFPLKSVHYPYSFSTGSFFVLFSFLICLTLWFFCAFSFSVFSCLLYYVLDLTEVTASEALGKKISDPVRGANPISLGSTSSVCRWPSSLRCHVLVSAQLLSQTMFSF